VVERDTEPPPGHVILQGRINRPDLKSEKGYSGWELDIDLSAAPELAGAASSPSGRMDQFFAVWARSQFASAREDKSTYNWLWALMFLNPASRLRLPVVRQSRFRIHQNFQNCDTVFARKSAELLALIFFGEHLIQPLIEIASC